MRDLEADLTLCKQAPVVTGFIAAARVGWPEAIKRAIAAEDRVDKLEEEIRLLHDILNQSNKA